MIDTQEQVDRCSNIKQALRVRFGICLSQPMTRSVMRISDRLRSRYSGDRLIMEACLEVRRFTPNDSSEVGQAVLLLCIYPQLHV